ncbi:MAG: CvpA family protein [SAR202 cluster bacterium]|nr:CvpA family protein [SAR202 cluster bacterium]|tara:strand:- start:527 stop:1129 length:603 start_codon:yes stop_codon:yes gene_type:complete
MNWLDIVFVLISIIAIFYGLKTGLFSAVFILVGIVIGWQIAGHYSDNIGSSLSNTISSDRTVSVISYVVIMILAIVIAKLASNMIKPLISVASFGISSLIDKLGGLVVGIILAGFICGAIIMGMTRVAYTFEIPDFAGDSALEIINLDSFDANQSLNNLLSGSSFVRTFVKVVENIPADAIGFVPDDYDISVQMLSEQVE